MFLNNFVTMCGTGIPCALLASWMARRWLYPRSGIVNAVAMALAYVGALMALFGRGLLQDWDAEVTSVDRAVGAAFVGILIGVSIYAERRFKRDRSDTGPGHPVRESLTPANQQQAETPKV